MAAKNGCNEAAKLLLAHGAFVEAKANVNFWLLKFLVFFNFYFWLRLLMFSHLIAFVESVFQNGMTPLHLAVWHSLRAEDCSTVNTLLEYNADCSAEDNVWSCFKYFIAYGLFWIFHCSLLYSLG